MRRLLTPCVQTGPCREWIWWCRPRLGQCHGTAAPWDPGDTKEENPRPATPLTSVVSESGLPVRGSNFTFWRFHSFCPSSLVTNPVLGVGLLIGHPSTAEFNQDPDWPIPRCGFEIKPTRAPIAATIPAPTLCNSTQPNEYHGRHRRLQLRRRCPPHRGPQALLQEGLASRCVPPPRVTTACRF